ncbi:Binding-protein-dependent transport system inner membrane component [Acididesulfobacillus acetoxydans]|uniref:Binding-protein-dependent transport system inner membrane component n=1 Tax=Acididesulfobacillus acetoxydans TaxID=1561005 RepID=A0A8S0W9I0_9FIRM|nr:ABC transporter permease subunit [Acididesulfobacillus acetoxydans]CAA7602619.1 Binding-protein-dependent transport system inner membrane component [Acididesulfobacillus acetoxydans]CEJ09184.1 Binding-protein-dependent transport systems inner membrane component [Acididesulfobacillus acetoxydans]
MKADHQDTGHFQKDTLLLLPSLLPLLLIFLYPLIQGILLTLHKNGEAGFTFYNYIQFFTVRDFSNTIFRTLVLVIPSSILEMTLAFAMAYHLRKPIRGKGLLNGLIMFPLTLGPLIVAVGMIDFFKPNGWFNLFLMHLGILHQPAQLLYNFWGTFISLTILGVGFIFSNLVGLMDSIDPSFEQAARSLGANGFQTFIRVFYPLIRSGVWNIFSLNVIMQLAVYSSAIIVGNPASSTRVFSVVAFEQAMQYFNYNMAETIAVIMAAVQFICLGVVHYIRKKGYVGSASTFK